MGSLLKFQLNTLSGDDCRLLVDTVQDYAIFMLDPNGNVASWNRGAERMTGYRAEEIVGSSISTLYPPGVSAGALAQDLELTRKFGRLEHEGLRVRKDGQPFWANVILTVLRDHEGGIRGFANVTRDVTAQRTAEEALRRSEERFRLLTEAVQDYAIYMLDLRGNVDTWNAGAERIKGYKPEEIIGKNYALFFPEEDVRAGAPEHELQVALTMGRFEQEGYRIRKDGTRFWAGVVLTTIRDDHGRPIAFAKVTRDLTERRRVEQELRESEQRLRLLVESVRDYAIYMLDPQGNISTWNAGAETLKGYKPHEVLGRNYALFFPPEDVAAGKPEEELEIARTQGRFEQEGERVRKDGTRFWANVVLTPIRDDGGELIGFAKVTRDLTARREAEETARTLMREQAARAAAELSKARLKEAAQLAEQAAKRSEEANRMKDAFLATVSHELRTPLNAILGWAAVLRGRIDPANANAIEVIHRNAQAQAKIIEDILDVSRIMTGKLQLDLKATDLVVVVRDALEVVRPSADAKRISLALSHDPEPHLLVADPDRLQQVAWNLLSNAMKFSRAGSQVSVAILREGSRFVLSVKDEGIGIEPSFLPFVFDPFRQADDSTTRRVGGLGLGLSIVRHLVELHGGEVRASSEGPGTGATFTVSLPIRAIAPSDPPENPQNGKERTSGEAATSAGLLLGTKILLVDDEDDSRELVRIVLEVAGASVESARNAQEGFEAVQRFRPDVLISDIGMPDSDGYSLVRRVSELEASRGGRIPCIALTAYAHSRDKLKALSAGFTAHLAKPVQPEELVATVLNLAAFVGR
jgi:PAS domain S-box-containing protein